MTQYLYLLPYGFLTLYLGATLYRDRMRDWQLSVVVVAAFMFIVAFFGWLSGLFLESTWIVETIIAVILVVLIEFFVWRASQPSVMEPYGDLS